MLVDDYNIKMVFITGDVTNSAMPQQWMDSKTILDKLKIPYFPTMGNPPSCQLDDHRQPRCLELQQHIRGVPSDRFDLNASSTIHTSFTSQLDLTKQVTSSLPKLFRNDLGILIYPGQRWSTTTNQFMILIFA